ncbi:MAG TPA: chemotaxis protein CheW [Ignavibacteriaceae bacterium]|nr:chemotaxis protein CheW [Ignavibacteriaceae bacterium]
MKISQLFDVMPGMYIFKISGLEFCVNVRDVYNVKRLAELNTWKDILSNGGEYLTIDNFNIPVIDISRYFDIMDKEWSESRMIIIIKHQSENDFVDKTYAIIADEVTEIISIDKKNSNNRPMFIPADGNPFLSGSVFFGGREILLPNFSKIANTVFLGNETFQRPDLKLGN